MIRKRMAAVFRWPVLLFARAVLAAAGAAASSFLFLRGLGHPTPGPDGPAAVQVRLVAALPGASAEDVEKQVTIPLEVTLAGMPGLQHTYSR